MKIFHFARNKISCKHPLKLVIKVLSAKIFETLNYTVVQKNCAPIEFTVTFGVLNMYLQEFTC